MIKNIILAPKPNIVFLMISSKDGMKFSLEISQKTDITYSHVLKLISKFHRHGLVSREKKGRKVLLNLTVKGKEVKDKLGKLHKQLNKIDQKNIKVK
ncbi:MAG: hypothetical protein UR20_C0033G0002 [Candidatus Woesebacteria bacterium GW2011_GWE2_31_6]|nr:MAG: hypothetical protein UR20_C0033G0002 [Candidatus Woesebacteria bacterium GW2011_GWE2_31_6]